MKRLKPTKPMKHTTPTNLVAADIPNDPPVRGRHRSSVPLRFPGSPLRRLAVLLLAVGVSLPAWAEPRTVRIGVDGMVCAFCAQGIEKKLKARSEVDRIFVSLENRIVAVGFKDGRTMSDADLDRLIVDSGYKVTGIARVDDSVDAIRESVRRR
jgi:copper chaperone CopZ